ncbi:transposase [Sphingomonas psychrotolerans]|uniref:transposase n=1 Tax=Sphingomonas psychrotolerans TaxID=1327635 RepID=UPI00130531AF|nr:transposase [Sphingomonas psychrotolerans]
MPLVIDSPHTDAIELGEIIEYLHDENIDTSDHDQMIAAAPMLKRLSNNRSFLGDMALDELKKRTGIGNGSNNYGPQVIMLYAPTKRQQTFFLRANFWPSNNDHILRASGPEQFFYHHPHDHSFNFLTVGHFGPGYSSNYYTYDYEDTAGYPGEPVDLKFVEKSSLSEGKVMLYRACYDIHDQLPPESMSISLNIMELTVRGSVVDQYGFDVERNFIGNMINRMSMCSLMPMIAQVGGENAQDYLAETARSHLSERVRFAALKAIAATRPDLEGTMEVFEQGTRSESALVAGWAQHKLTRLESLRA